MSNFILFFTEKRLNIYFSSPKRSSELVGTSVELSSLEMLVIETISNGVHFVSDGEQISVESLGLEVLEWVQ